LEAVIRRLVQICTHTSGGNICIYIILGAVASRLWNVSLIKRYRILWNVECLHGNNISSPEKSSWRVLFTLL
jgi:hypothetical protein